MICKDTIVARLKARGERLTLQRSLVLDVLCEHADHLTVQDIQGQLRENGADLAETTVYRIVQWLKDQSVVSQTDLGRSGVVYELLDQSPHHHLVCLNCGAVIEIPDDLFEPLRARLQQDYHFAPRIEHMAIFGLCPNCQETHDD